MHTHPLYQNITDFHTIQSAHFSFVTICLTHLLTDWLLCTIHSLGTWNERENQFQFNEMQTQTGDEMTGIYEHCRWPTQIINKNVRWLPNMAAVVTANTRLLVLLRCCRNMSLLRWAQHKSDERRKKKCCTLSRRWTSIQIGWKCTLVWSLPITFLLNRITNVQFVNEMHWNWSAIAIRCE